MANRMSMRDVLKHLIPLFIDDVSTLRAYVKAIGISKQAIEGWKRKHIKHIIDTNDKYVVRYSTLLNDIVCGRIMYQGSYCAGKVRVEGEYRDGLPIGDFTISRWCGEWYVYKIVTYVNGVKSKVIRKTTETTYVNGKKAYAIRKVNDHVTLTIPYNDYRKVTRRYTYIITDSEVNKLYEFTFVRHSLHEVKVGGVVINDEDKCNELYEHYRYVVEGWTQ
jgi:hypothetical protein